MTHRVWLLIARWGLGIRFPDFVGNQASRIKPEPSDSIPQYWLWLKDKKTEKQNITNQPTNQPSKQTKLSENIHGKEKGEWKVNNSIFGQYLPENINTETI